LPQSAADSIRYRAFISYSHSDKAIATWLHRALETYRIPSKLVGLKTAVGAVPRRLTPIFRDRDELSASGDLGAELTEALRDSMFLVVLCSPAATRSRWVGEEIIAFRRMHGEGRVLALIVGGEPGASEIPGKEALECFPAALRFRMNADGELSDEVVHHIAADLRAGSDGRHLAKLKLVAGLTGLHLDDLVQREAQRRARSLAAITGASLTGMMLAGGLALYANARRIEADEQRRVAQRETAVAQRETAKEEATTNFLLGAFKLMNPATDNPRSISALTILQRGAEQARTNLATQPAIHARILEALGKAYNNLGLSQELTEEMNRSLPAIRSAGPDGAGALFQLANAYNRLGKFPDALRAIGLAESVLGPGGKSDPLLAADLAVTKASILYSQGELDKGLASADAAVRLYRGVSGSDPAKLAWALHERGLILSDQGKYADADAALSESMELYRRKNGERNLSTATAWYALALNDQQAGRLSRAAARIAQALAIQRVVLDPDNPILADSYSLQGQIFQGQNKLDAAAAALNQAVAIYRKAFHGPNAQIGIALVYLAQVESDQGQTARALADLDEAKRNYDASYGQVSPNHGDLLVYRAKVLAKAGRKGEARADCAAGLAILDQTLGASASFTKSDAAICAAL
jgi:tetratricopeptide (TPR) repeat protein